MIDSSMNAMSLMKVILAKKMSEMDKNLKLKEVQHLLAVTQVQGQHKNLTDD